MRDPDRRSLIGGAFTLAGLMSLGLPGAAGAAVPASGALKFAVLRNGQPFGDYGLTFARKGDALVVTTDVKMQARVAGLTVFDYRHHCEETWRAGQFVEMRSHSVRDNQTDWEDIVTAVRATGRLNVTTKGGLTVLPADARPLTHWNVDNLEGTPLFNPQTGELLKLRAQSVGREAIRIADGRRLNATHWILSGETRLEEWYDDNGIWAGLRGPLPDKSTLEYRRV